MRNLASTVRNIAVALLLVVVAFGVYFFLYIQQRERLVTEHHLRLLLNSCDYATDALSGLLVNVENAARLGDNDTFTESLSKEIDRRRALIHGLFYDPDSLIAGVPRDSILYDDSIARINISPDRRNTWPRLSLAVVLDSPPSGPRLDFVFVRGSTGRYRADSLRAWKADLDEVLGSTLPTEVFSTVLLVRSSGEVLLQRGESHLSLARLGLPPRAGGEADSSRPPGRAPFSHVVDVRIAGEAYKLFLQPMRVPITLNARDWHRSGSWRAEERWFMAGLLPAARFRTMSMEIAPSIALLTIALIALGLCCLPLLKIRFLGPREEFRFRDLARVAATLVLGSSLVTFSALYILALQKDADRGEETLADFSQQIEGQLGRELGQLDTTLALVTRARGSTRSVRCSLLTSTVADSPGFTPFFEMVYWIDSDGAQTSKWTIRTRPTPFVSVAQRSYFSALTTGRSWSGPSPAATLFRDGRYVTSIRSTTTGRMSAVLARLCRPHSLANPDGRDQIAAIESRLRSVISPALPPGLGFAIVDPSGLVQFHSESARNVREILFDELVADDEMREAVASRNTAIVRTTYGTAPCLMRVSPIDGTNWSLVVFEDEGASRIRLVELLGTALIVFSLYLVVLALTGCTVFHWWKTPRRFGERRRLWYWPTPRKIRAYNVLILALGGWLLVWIVVLAARSPAVVLLMTLLSAPVALGLFRVVLRRRHAGSGGWPEWFSRRHFRRAYQISLTLVVISIGVLPAVGVFLTVRGEAETLHLERQQIQFLRSLTARSIDNLDWFASAPMGHFNSMRMLGGPRGNSQGTAIGIYPPKDWRWRRGGLQWKNQPMLPVSNVLHSIFSRFGLASQRTASLASPSNLYYRWYLGGGELALEARGSIPAGTVGGPIGSPHVSSATHSVYLAAPLPGANRRDWLRLLPMAAFALAALYWMVYLTVSEVFLARFRMPRRLGSSPDACATTRGVLLGCRLAERERTDAHVITVRDLGNPVVELVQDIGDASEQDVVLEQFDRALRDPATIGKALDVLEALLAMEPAPRRILLETSVEPLDLLLAKCRAHGVDEMSANTMERWATALQDFRRIASPPGPECREPVVVPAGLNPRVNSALAAEGAPTPVLGRIAQDIAADKDLAHYGVGDVIAAFLDRAQAHYRRLWTTCSNEEKLLLHGIATEGFVNRNATGALAGLIRRGLVKHPCRIMNESFRQFVRSAEPPDVLAEWRERGGPSTWARMRNPLLLAFGGLAILFFATQRNALDQTLGLLAAVTAVAPGLLNVVSGLGRLRQGSAAKST